MTGVLYARVGSSWIPISGAGASVPAGGVAGDLIVKVSTTDMDVRWGTDAPMLALTSGTAVTLASTTHPLQLGVTAGVNVAMDASGTIQARSNGAVNTLTLNPLGGTIQLGSGSPQQVRIGNDAYLTDVNVAHAMGLKSTTDATQGFLYLGSGVKLLGTADYLDTQANNLYWDINGGTFHWRRMSDFADMMNLDTAGALNVASSVSSGGSLYAAGNIYTGSGQSLVAQGASGGIYWSAYNRNLYMQDASWIRANCGLYTGGEIRGGFVTADSWMSLNAYGNSLYFGPSSDPNHRAWYTTETPPGSGFGMNGPVMQGYSTCALRTALNNRWLMLEWGAGSVFIDAGGSYLKFSSRETKSDIQPLDPEQCLEQVRRWEPVEFTPNSADWLRKPGFVAEDLHEVTPLAVYVTPEDADRPNWPNAVDYAGLTVPLAGAVQALLARIEALEGAMQ